MKSTGRQWLALALVTATLLGAAPGIVQAADHNWAVDAPTDFAVMLWSNPANWDTLPVDGNSVEIKYKTTWNRVKLDVESGVDLPNSDIVFKDRKTHLFSSAGTPGVLTAKSISASMGGGYDVYFESPVVVETFTSQASKIQGGITADLLTSTLRCTIEASSTTNVLGEAVVKAESNSGWYLQVDAPVTLRSGGSGNTTVTTGQYRANVDGALLPGTVNLDVPTDSQARTGGSSLSMVAQTVMPAMINANGIGTGVVIDDASALIYTGGAANITLAPDSAFRDQSDGQVSAGGNGPTAADLPGLIYWAMDSTSNNNLATNVYTLTTNSLDANSPYKGFAFGTFCSRNANAQQISLKMADGDLGNMQIVTAMSQNNYSRFTDDTTMIHAPGGSSTADILCVNGLASSGDINKDANTAGTPNLIDKFHFIANKPGMRLVHRLFGGGILPEQEFQLDNGYMTWGGGTGLQGTLRIMEGGMLVWDTVNQSTGGGTIVIEDGGFLQIENQEVMDNLTVAQILTPGSAAGLILRDTSYDSDLASATLLDVIDRTNIVGRDESTYAGIGGLVIAAGKHFAGVWNSDTDIRGGRLASAAGTDLQLVSPGTRQVRFHAATVDAGTNDIVVGTDPGVEVYAMESANTSWNSSGTDGEVIKQRPTGTVDFNATTTVVAGGLNIKSGTVRQFLDLSLDRLTLGADGTLALQSGKGFTVNSTLSGTGKWTGGTGVVVATGATVAPGAGIGTLNSGGGELIVAAGSTYEWEMKDGNTTGAAGTDWDLLMASNITFEGDLTFKVLNAGLAGGLDGSEEWIVASVTGAIDDTLLTVTFDLPGWSGGSLAVVGKDLVLSGLTTSLVGDADGNGVVNAADYIILKTNMGTGTGAGAAAGDFNGDGNVDWDDLQLLQDHYGEGSAASGVIPEPATLGLLAIGAMALIRRRRRS